MKKIKVLIADDHTIVRQGICSLLKSRDDMSVVGEASTGKEAIEKVEALHPDVALLDISMPILNGLEATRYIRKDYPDCKVLVLTMHENKESVRQVLQAGASGYVVKKSAASQLFDAIHAVSKGEAFFSPSISKMLLDDYTQGAVTPDEPLSLREREVLQLVAEGHPNREISSFLHISVKTVEGHKDNIRKKLGLQDQAGLIKYAIQKGIIQLESVD
ncbi:MAG: response regulator transcription factor [Candidatus Thermoplasmatota archaeon]